MTRPIDAERHRDLAGSIRVAPPGRDPEENRQRIHGNALVPAVGARDEILDLGEVEAAEGRHQGDHQRQRDLAAGERLADAIAQSASPVENCPPMASSRPPTTTTLATTVSRAKNRRMVSNM